jgi:flavin reductase (DIM6/NTAB) family NADH-FMN oxidoreductase RutF
MTATDLVHSMKMIQGRQIAALLNPRPAVLVTCCDESCVPNVLTIAWHTPLSHNPPLVGISIDSRRYSHELIQKCGEFVLNIVPQEFQPAVELCGNHSGRDLEKIAAAGLSLQPAYHVHPPLIQGALAHLECVVENRIRTGDHTFFISRVLYAEAKSDCFSDAWVPTIGNVLVCLQRDRYGTWSSRMSGLEK